MIRPTLRRERWHITLGVALALEEGQGSCLEHCAYVVGKPRTFVAFTYLPWFSNELVHVTCYIDGCMYDMHNVAEILGLSPYISVN